MIFKRRRAERATATLADTTNCPHVSELPEPEPEPNTREGCTECLADGTTWLHLRKCLTCGHVACCDSTPYRHATVHHERTGHPVMRSFEPGEAWRWCFTDQLLV